MKEQPYHLFHDTVKKLPVASTKYRSCRCAMKSSDSGNLNKEKNQFLNPSILKINSLLNSRNKYWQPKLSAKWKTFTCLLNQDAGHVQLLPGKKVWIHWLNLF